MAPAKVTIAREDRGEAGRYVARLEGSEHRGYLDWVGRGPGVRVATHTRVPPAIGGRGVAARLVEALVADAREQGLRIVPACSFVEAMFRRNREWDELRA